MRWQKLGCLIFLGLMYVLILPTVAYAAPQPNACDDPDFGARMKCKLANALAQQEETANMINQMDDVPEGRKQALMNLTQRGMRAEGRSVSDDFKGLTKMKNAKCQVVEILGDGDGDDDGICRGQEDCAEVLGDQIGDDDGICKPRKGNNREACVEICDDEAVNENPDNFDDVGRGADIEEELDELTDTYVELNEMIEMEMAVQAAAQSLSASGDPCAAVIVMRQSTNVIAFAVGAKIGAETAADISDKFCNQDAAGFNSAAVCAIPQALAGVAVLIADTMQFVDGVIDSDTIDTSFACIKEMSLDVDQLLVEVGETNDALTAIEDKVDVLDLKMDEVIVLLNTPPGQRPNFPISVGPQGRVGIHTTSPETDFHVVGDTILDGDLALLSSRDAKESFAAVDPQAVLAQLAELPVLEWSYRGNAGVRHLGPVAEDFHASFRLGGDGQSINPLDLAGVALAATQGLHLELDRLARQGATTMALLHARDLESARLEVDGRGLRSRIEALEGLLQELSERDRSLD